MNEITGNETANVLGKASEGLLFPSETDAPFTSFFWSATTSDPFTPAALTEFVGAATDAPIKTVKLANFFRDAVKEEDWHNAEEKAEAARFQELLETIKSSLESPQVFRVGATKMDVYIVGKVEGGYAGLKTEVVET